MIHLVLPVSQPAIDALQVGDILEISGRILCGRDAVLPRLCRLVEEGRADELPEGLRGGLIFHTAVSRAGIGPTSSNKLEIESSIGPLSRAGVKIHLGKGALKRETVVALAEYGSVFAVTPPATALFMNRMLSARVVAFPEEGIEALHEVEVDRFPAIVAAAHGVSLFDLPAR